MYHFVHVSTDSRLPPHPILIMSCFVVFLYPTTVDYSLIGTDNSDYLHVRMCNKFCDRWCRRSTFNLGQLLRKLLNTDTLSNLLAFCTRTLKTLTFWSAIPDPYSGSRQWRHTPPATWTSPTGLGMSRDASWTLDHGPGTDGTSMLSTWAEEMWVTCYSKVQISTTVHLYCKSQQWG